MMQKHFKSLILMLISIAMLSVTGSAFSCTRVLRIDKSNAVMVGRNMDWMQKMQTNLRVYPRGAERVGDIGDNPLEWTSKYGSIVATAYGNLTTDGINEAGLGAHFLWLNATDYGKRDESRPGLVAFMWIQYYLDSFKSVDEAVRATENSTFQITPFQIPVLNKWVKLHLVLDDSSGDSAIFEYIGGKLHVYHDRKYITTTNDPTYDKQLANLKRYKVFGGDKPLPGTSNPADRFVRATHYITSLPKVSSVKDELAEVLSVINNAAQPYRIPDPGKPYASKTIWHTVSDLTHKVYYFQSTETQSLLYTSLDKFNLNQGAPIMQLDIPNHPEYVGDVTSKFKVLD